MNRRPVKTATLSESAVIAPMTRAFQDAAPLPRGSNLEWTPDEQIVGYRAAEKIRPGRVAGRGSYVHLLPLAIQQISPHWIWKNLAMDVDRHMQAQRTSGIIVLKNGVVILERYGLGRTAKDRWMANSVSKSVTALLVGAAIQDGFINGMDAPVTDHIPELAGSAYDGVSFRHLLTMTSGVKWSEDYTDPQADVNQLVREPFVNGVDPIVAYMRRLPRVDQPGATFVYKTGETELTGISVCRAVGKSLSEYLSDKLWQPYGMEKDAHWVVDPAGYEYGGFGLSMTLRDFARIGQFMLDGGKAGVTQVLPPGWAADATSAQVAIPPSHRLGSSTSYGYFWWIYKDGYAALGHAGQAIIVYPKDKVVIAINSVWPEPETPENFNAQAAFVEALYAAAVAQPLGAMRVVCHGES